MVKRKQKIEKSNDDIREIILKFFYDLHRKASNPKQTKLKITEVKSKLKEFDLNSKEIISNLDYLIQTGFIIKEEESYQIRKGKSIFPSIKTYYKASDKTINYFEGPSKFQKIDKSIAGINITNIQGVAVVGDQNIINTQYTNLYKELDLLSEAIRRTDQIKDEEKLNYVSEIETIKSQLSKKEPDKNIIKLAWEKLKPLATISGILSLFTQVSKLVSNLLY